MKLLIDTSNSQKISIVVGEKRVVEDVIKERAQVLLSLIHKELKNQGKTVGDIDQIEVVTGPGSFTGLRIGCAVANALAWALQIKVNRQRPPVTPTY